MLQPYNIDSFAMIAISKKNAIDKVPALEMRNLVKPKLRIVIPSGVPIARKHDTLGNDIRSYTENFQVGSGAKRRTKTIGRSMLLRHNQMT